MSDPDFIRLPNENQVQLRLHGAREQLALLRDALQQQRPNLAEAAACAVIDQSLKAVTAALHEFNLLLPHPLPAERVSWRNLRARFIAVQIESAALNFIEEQLRPYSGWLWWLDRKEQASAFAPLLHWDSQRGTVAIWRDPLNPTAGVEADSPLQYLSTILDRIEEATRELARLARKDVEEYRRAARRQPGRMA